MKNFYIEETWFDLMDSTKHGEKIIFESDDLNEVIAKAKKINLATVSIDSTTTYYLHDRINSKVEDIRNYGF